MFWFYVLLVLCVIGAGEFGSMRVVPCFVGSMSFGSTCCWLYVFLVIYLCYICCLVLCCIGSMRRVSGVFGSMFVWFHAWVGSMCLVLRAVDSMCDWL